MVFNKAVWWISFKSTFELDQLCSYEKPFFPCVVGLLLTRLIKNIPTLQNVFDDVEWRFQMYFPIFNNKPKIYLLTITWNQEKQEGILNFCFVSNLLSADTSQQYHCFAKGIKNLTSSTPPADIIQLSIKETNTQLSSSLNITGIEVLLPSFLSALALTNIFHPVADIQFAAMFYPSIVCKHELVKNIILFLYIRATLNLDDHCSL